MTDNKYVIALLGQPNSGKSTIFNALTGLRQHVGNWPGKTVEKKEGSFARGGKEYLVADLPGTYSLSANSDEEIITRDYIASGKADVVCILADSSQLERSLYMLSDYAGIDVPCFLVLNLADVAADQGKKIDVKALHKKLSIPVVLLSATDPKNYNEFYYALDEAIANRTVLNADALKDEYEKIEGFDELKALIPDNVMNGYSSLWLASKAIEGDRVVRAKIKDALGGKACAEYMNLIEKFTKGALQTGESKFKWIDYLLDGVVNKVETKPVFGKFDKAITSRRWGKIIVILVVIGGLIGSFIPALPLMGVGMGISAAGAAISSAMTEAGCPGLLTGIVCNVLIQSLAFIVQMLGFVFGVTLVFGMLEEIGVMAR
ncbi:MAG: ferrous iron transporter B, partial [Lachnospiraceae bacterium]|nr:ferrous iron transporter B [Lachnospiraceae bacterium]